MEHINRMLVHTTNYLLKKVRSKLVVTVEAKHVFAAYKSCSAPSRKMKATILFMANKTEACIVSNCLNENRMGVIR